jgi:hypothetical protein
MGAPRILPACVPVRSRPIGQDPSNDPATAREINAQSAGRSPLAQLRAHLQGRYNDQTDYQVAVFHRYTAGRTCPIQWAI